MRAIRYHEDARDEFLHEVSYYTAISPRLGERFDQAVQMAEALAARSPELGSPYQHGTRRVFTKTFKFALVYLYSDTEILILAVAPFRKKPGYWKLRGT